VRIFNKVKLLSSMTLMTPALDTAYLRYEFDDDVLIATYKKGRRITFDIAKEIVRERIEFTERQPVLVLLIDRGVTRFDKAARDYMASSEGTKYIKAGAILCEGPATAMIGNFIVKVNKPHIPVRLFTNRERAIGWLKSKA
jgi:hypothetical protein